MKALKFNKIISTSIKFDNATKRIWVSSIDRRKRFNLNALDDIDDLTILSSEWVKAQKVNVSSMNENELGNL